MPAKSKADSRSSSGVKTKRTKGIQATPEGSAAANKKRGKSAKKRGAAGKGKGVNTGTDADPPIIERENTALISGEQKYIAVVCFNKSSTNIVLFFENLMVVS